MKVNVEKWPSFQTPPIIIVIVRPLQKAIVTYKYFSGVEYVLAIYVCYARPSYLNVNTILLYRKKDSNDVCKLYFASNDISGHFFGLRYMLAD